MRTFVDNAEAQRWLAAYTAHLQRVAAYVASHPEWDWSVACGDSCQEWSARYRGTWQAMVRLWQDRRDDRGRPFPPYAELVPATTGHPEPLP